MDIGMMRLMHNGENGLMRLRKIINRIKGMKNILEVLKSRRGFDAIESQSNTHKGEMLS